MSLRGCPAHAGRVGLELTKAYIQKGWKVIAAVRDPKSMPKTEGGEVVVIKLDAGEKEDAKKASLFSPIRDSGDHSLDPGGKRMDVELLWCERMR